MCSRSWETSLQWTLPVRPAGKVLKSCEVYMNNQMARESSISRLLSYSDRYDCAIVTAFRRYKGCDSTEKYTAEDNAQRNANLHAKLMGGLCLHAALSGFISEGNEVVKAVSFFVINCGWGRSKPFFRFMHRIKRFGVEFNQNAVLIVPKGAISSIEYTQQGKNEVRCLAPENLRGRPFLIRTNNSRGDFPVRQDKKMETLDRTRLYEAVGNFPGFVNGRNVQARRSDENEVPDRVEVKAVYFLPNSLRSAAGWNQLGKKPWQCMKTPYLDGSKPAADYSELFSSHSCCIQ